MAKNVLDKLSPEQLAAAQALVNKLTGKTGVIAKRMKEVEKIKVRDYRNQTKQQQIQEEKLTMKREAAGGVLTEGEATHLFLDDLRNPGNVTWTSIPQGASWRVVRNYTEFTEHITKYGLPEYISFDHDLGGISQKDEMLVNGKDGKSGHDCAKWLVDFCLRNNQPLPDWNCHSMNTVGKMNIEAYLYAFPTMKRAYDSRIV